MIALFAALSLLAVVQCQDDTTVIPIMASTHKAHHHHNTHTHAPRPTHESGEREGYVFHYDGVSHDMVVTNHKNCYIMALNDVQRAQVHTDGGIKKVEISALVLILDTTAQKVVDKTVLAHHEARFCKGMTTIYTLTPPPTA